ncbi:hypothetical protein [Mycobacterium sp. DBP42]|uniref:hypothetical protein n=1 Tax=Mycobacteriaceae TaxID=1762 RepID=UPI00110CA9A4|nr:hypothetical protein [Mycobacterium sp. DBP42]TMS50703.1 hypothetical protein E0T84_22725 [Mycobacterium sp. DBP42]
MLSRSINRVFGSIFLRLSGGDAVRADELRTRVIGALFGFILLTYVPLMAAVVVLVLSRPQPVDEYAQRDWETAIKAYAIRYVNTYLKDPSNSDALKSFCIKDLAGSDLAPGGYAVSASSALPGVVVDGVQTWSVLVDTQVPKAANAAAMADLPLQVDISIDRRGFFCAFSLPHARTERPAGQPAELATDIAVTEGRPVYNTAVGFLNAMLVGNGDLAPFVAAGSNLRAAQPPFFASVSIDRMQANSEVANAQDVPVKADGVEVTIRAELLTPAGVAMPMDFPLVMSVAAGHWQVDRINDAPGIVAPPESGTGDSSSTPTTTSSSVPSARTTPRPSLTTGSSTTTTPEGN